MSHSRASPQSPSLEVALLWPGLLVLSFLAGYTPTFLTLLQGPWKSDQGSHGPFIIAASLWWVWQARAKLRAVPLSPAPIAGWSALLLGLLLMFFGRTQGVAPAEVLSAIVVIIACVLLLAGAPLLRALAFPIGFLIFAVPAPDWMLDTATVPLKVHISDLVTRILYDVGYPIAQNGVMIMIGSYQVLVKDACSGMNSIFALSALGVFYACVFRRDSKVRSLLLLLAIVPIAITANLIRVLTLVLLAYYAGVDALEGSLHGLTGIGLFILALTLLYLFDKVLSFIGVLSRWIHPPPIGVTNTGNSASALHSG